MKECIAASALLPLDNTADVSLRNSFTHKLASPAQQHDLLNFTIIGECHFNIYVQHMYLGNSSVKPTARQHRLKTFATIKATKIGKESTERKKFSFQMLKKYIDCFGHRFTTRVMNVQNNNIWNCLEPLQQKMGFQTKAKKVILHVPHFTQKGTVKMQFFQFSHQDSILMLL